MISNRSQISKLMCLNMTTTIIITPKILTQICFRGNNWSLQVRGKQRIIICIDQLFGNLIVTPCRMSVMSTISLTCIIGGTMSRLLILTATCIHSYVKVFALGFKAQQTPDYKRTFLPLGFHWVLSTGFLSGGHWVLHPSLRVYILYVF